MNCYYYSPFLEGADPVKTEPDANELFFYRQKGLLLGPWYCFTERKNTIVFREKDKHNYQVKNLYML